MVVAGRFTIEELAGRGGMGFVYRALDALTGQRVALKLMHAVTAPDSVYRFNREAVLLAELRHPHIVSHVAHGVAEGDQPFLAMEWLEGEDLARRLLRQPLGLSETLDLLRRTAEALATAHRQGIVHRDIKPSNLFLRGGRPEDVVLLDFGLARHVMRTMMGVTRSGMVVGTPGYMAPEQASSQQEIPPSADIFSLGCVLYECLTGQPPFEAPHFAAALAKILFAEPAPLHTLRAELPPGLQGLVDRMLAKDPKRRLPDAASLLEALSALESEPTLVLTRPEQEPPSPSLARAEQQLVSVLLVSGQLLVDARQGEEEARALALRESLRTTLGPYGARVELLADGSLVATLLPEHGAATDQAALAARCALAFKERWPEAAVVLTTGLGVFRERLPVGEVMDRAGRLLRQLEKMPGSSSVVLDEVSAGLLGAGFRLSRSDSGTFLLQGEQLSADASRPLLGKPTPCVGREQELALLNFTFDTCAEEPTARALLVTAPAGGGKSRLRHEFLRRLEGGGRQVLVLLGRGDPMTVGASYGLLGQAVRRLCGIVDGERLEAHRERLLQRVALHLPDAEAREAVEFLGELCTIPFPDEGSTRLRAARADPRLMSAQVSRALVAFLRAECAHCPVLLVLEDLHWSDALTIKLVDELLRDLSEQPLLVLALARPEVKEAFPGLWGRRLQELPLSGLNRKAGARLVREVLGAQVSDSVIQRVVEQSDGNALFLEELIRMAAEGRGEAAPETVLAVLQGRLSRMDPGARQVLLAASFFGRTFWAGGVAALLGWQSERTELEKHLRQLVEQEVIELLPSSRFPAETEYRFRHALVRDAAYGLLPDSQRPVGHQRAATWLEQLGESEAVVLAAHYHQGQQLERAASFYTRAAEQFFERNDLPGALRCVEAVLACGVSGGSLLRLRALQAVVAYWMEQITKCLELGVPALAGLEEGSLLWCRLMAGLIAGSGNLGRHEEMYRLGESLLRVSPEPGAITAYVEALSMLGSVALWSGERHKVEAPIARSLEIGDEVMSHDAVARGCMRGLQCQFFLFYEAKPWQAFIQAERGSQDFRDGGSERYAINLRTLLGAAQAALGDVPGAVALLREAEAAAHRAEQPLSVIFARRNLMQALVGSTEHSHLREAHALVLDWMRSDDNRSIYMRGRAYAILARVLAASGELHEAESYARKACELLVHFRPFLSFARDVFSTVLRALGRATEARQVAALGARELEQMGSSGVFAVGVHLALAEACFAEGDGEAGEAALRQSLQCVRTRANDIPDSAIRERFLRQVPENARTLELARQRWGEAGL
jgi:tetratricopeptide (TPR) repeat protein